MHQSYKALLSLFAILTVLPAAILADEQQPCSDRQVVIYSQHTFSRSLGLEPLVEISVGVLAFILFVISALAWWRDRRSKFLVVCLAFLMFTVKGFMGMLDLFYPRDSSILGTFADLLDFVILFLMVLAVIKD